MDNPSHSSFFIETGRFELIFHDFTTFSYSRVRDLHIFTGTSRPPWDLQRRHLGKIGGVRCSKPSGAKFYNVAIAMP